MHPWLHFKTITKHKLMVMHYCFRIGLYKQGTASRPFKYTPKRNFLWAANIIRKQLK